MKRPSHATSPRLARRLRLVAVAAVSACTTQSLAAESQQPQQPQGTSAAAKLATPADAVQTLHLAAGPLRAALKALGQRFAVQVVLDEPRSPALQAAGMDPFDGIAVPALDGAFTVQAAFSQLLEGSGLSFQFSAPAVVHVGLRAAESVSVSAALPTSVGLVQFTQPLLDTPQTVVAVPSFVLQDEGVTTLRDTLRNVPGISLAAGESGAQGDNLTVRGFTARNDIFLDGIRDFGSYYRDAFDYAQVEVLEGPAGVQFGRGSTGGVINQESKVPETAHRLDVAAQFGTDATRRLSVDFNQPLAAVSAGAAFRFNAFGDQGGVAGRDKAEVRRFGLAPSISFGLNGKTQTTLSYVHLAENDTPDYGLPWLFAGLAPGVNRSSYFGFAGQNFLKTDDDIVTGRVGHEVTPTLRVDSLARWANYPRNAQITEPQICANASVSVTVGGSVAALPAAAINTALPCAYTLATSPAAIQVNRNQIQIRSVEGDLWDQTTLTAHFKTLGLRHELTAGAEGGQEISNPVKTSYTFNKINAAPSTTLLNPNEQQSFAGTGYIASIAHAKSGSVGLYFVDTLHLGRLFELSGGIRFDRFATTFNLYQPTPPAGATVTAAVPVTTQVVAQPTYRAALVYKPGTHGSMYFDYGSSFNPSAETLSLSTSSALLPPEENETYEGGVKWSFLQERLLTEAAFFRTEKDNARETDPTNSNNIVLAGNQRVRGLTASVIGRLPRHLDLVLGYAYLDSAVLYSKLFPTSIGYRLANVPGQTFNAFVTHALPLRFQAGFGTNYVASRTASSTVPYVPTSFSGPQSYAAGSAPCGATATTCYTVLSTAIKQVPGYWVANAMLNRTLSDHLTLQANVNNLTNRFYIDEPHPSHLVPGAGLTALVGLNFKF